MPKTTAIAKTPHAFVDVWGIDYPLLLMTTEQTVEWGLYGGAGFIGQHLAHSVLSRYPDHHVTLLDIESPDFSKWKAPLQQFLADGRLTIVKADVRDYNQLAEHSKPFDVIVNLAAILREPGHRTEEYFETNVAGAQNVCRLADSVACKEIIFTSTIAVYGIHGRAVDEDTQVEPKTPYGQSKFEAEKIHASWVEQSGGNLSIIRPGVVFGPGENGNMTRLVRESLKRGRKIEINPDQPKAGIYIEELLEIIHWLRAQPLPDGQSHLVNGVSNENLSFNSYGTALQEILEFEKQSLTVPAFLLKLAASLMMPLKWVVPATSKIHPVRISKLTRVNDVKPAALISKKYPFRWPLKRALADWLERGL
jgi:nucleoside-diphosphate-sugar epimerase